VLAERRSGSVIILLGSLLGSLVAVVHMKGAGVGGAIAKSSGAFFFIWTFVALGVTALLSVILSALGLWHLPWRTAAPHKQAAGARGADRRNVIGDLARSCRLPKPLAALLRIVRSHYLCLFVSS
jgi:hypothetical protein